MSDNDIVQEFLVESDENLDRLDRDLIGLEKNPQDQEALAGVFRTIHTIKGTCGFLGFNKLEKVAHVGESLLTRLREGQLTLTPQITTALLGVVDAVRQMLHEIRSTGHDGESDYPELRETLSHLLQVQPAAAAPKTGDRPPEPGASPAQGSSPGGTNCAEPPPAEAAPSALELGTASQLPPSASERVDPRSGAALQAAEIKPREVSAETIRVGIQVLDKMMTLVGELVLARNQLLQISNGVEDAGLQAVSQRMNLIATELQEGVMKTRMQPIGNIWNQFPRTVRDVAHACGKEVQVAMEGKETELDKTIIEAIKDPLTHLVRNSVDHGIELPEDRLKAGKERSGRLILRAYHEGGQVNIEITDDGAGLKADRIRQKAIDRNLITAAQASHMTERDLFPMIFLPGFSTAEKITNVSGRGVGMDVVKTNVEKIGGTVDIQSTAGRGTTVRVKIPLTLAIVPALVVTCGGERYAIPQVSLLELVRIVPDDVAQSVEQVHGTPVYRLRGRLLPLVYLRDELKLAVDASAARREAVNIVVLQADDRQFGLVVDEINDTEEIVVKPLRQQLKMVKTFAGSSIMGDGRVALILDVLGLAQRANVVSQVREAGTKVEDASSPKSGSARQTLLLLQAGAARRMAIPLSSVARLEEFPAGAIERSGKQEVVQYRGRILPLVRVAEVIEGGAEIRSDGTVPLQVVVYTEQERSVGLVVEKILDIVEEEFVVEHRGKRSGILGSALIQKRVTDLLDVEGVVRSVEPGFFELEPQRQTAEWSE